MVRRFEFLPVYLIFSVIANTNLGLSSKDTSILCSIKERYALLAFKQGLTDGSGRLSSWFGEDCCRWIGVHCENITGSVVSLNLRNPYQYGNQNSEMALGGKISPSLLELKNLISLDLSMNNFNGTTIPKFMGSLQNLQYLNVSSASFSGKIPCQLGNLSKLRELDMSASYFTLQEVDNLQWLSSLSHLTHLDFSQVNLSKVTNWLEMINTLPSLSELHLQDCGLSNLPSITHLNFTFLKVLDLSWNGFNSSLPNWLYALNNLKHLNIGDSTVRGTLSASIGNLTSLTSLILEGNYLEGKLPKTLGNLCQLEEIILQENKFSGDITRTLASLFDCQPTRLESLHLYYNKLSGSLPRQLGNLTNLKYLDLCYNAFSGPIPESIGQLSELKILRLYLNSFEGIITEAHFTNLTNLQELDASSNSLALNVESTWTPKFQLTYLNLSSWILGPEFPAWLRTQNSLTEIHLSTVNISGKIPKWFWNISLCVSVLDLSNNHIEGLLPSTLNFIGFSTSIFLSSNNLSGPLPRLSSNVIELDLSNNFFMGNVSAILCNPPNKTNNLENVDLSYNFLSGELPRCSVYAPYLGMVKLNNNKLSGTIPSSLGFSDEMNVFNVRNNFLSGKLPPTLRNWRRLESIDLGGNEFSGNIPIWIGKGLLSLKLLGLHSNKFTGEIPNELCHLASLQKLDIGKNNLSGRVPRCFSNLSAMVINQPYTDSAISSGYIYETNQFAPKGLEREYSHQLLPLVTIIDLSDNNLSGEIPHELTKLLGLRFLILSRNNFTGNIPKEIGEMGEFLESLDLSRNQLTGLIPASMSNLTTLSYLDLSYNNLSGQIPTGPQLQRFDEISYTGNDGLCGPPLRVLCGGEDSGKPLTVEDEDGNPNSMTEHFFVTFGPGIVVGLVGFCAHLFFVKSWRIIYFRFIEGMIHKFLVFYNINKAGERSCSEP